MGVENWNIDFIDFARIPMLFNCSMNCMPIMVLRRITYVIERMFSVIWQQNIVT